MIADPPCPLRDGVIAVTLADNLVGEVAAVIAAQHRDYMHRPVVTVAGAVVGMYGSLERTLTSIATDAITAAQAYQPYGGTRISAPRGMMEMLALGFPVDLFANSIKPQVFPDLWPDLPGPAAVNLYLYHDRVAEFDPATMHRDAASAVASGWVLFRDDDREEIAQGAI